MSDSERQAKEIFWAALDYEGDIKAFIEQACGDQSELRRRVDGLFEAHRAAGDFLGHDNVDATLDSEGAPNNTATAPGRSEPIVSSQIGPYKLLQEIGEGGMGTVWVAQQSQPIKRKVAIKLIKAGMDTRQVLARFEAERQALAMMDHPNIARVLDGGATSDGQPYFVMELVNGTPLDKYCDSAQLTLDSRLELFIPICQAVQHAHYKGIVHRDLKPSNILVTMVDGRPVPKVIDFGVAKATSGKLTEETLTTGFGAMVGTLEYMSPEQAAFSADDIDTRADIYSLGVILYELLTGRRPADSNRLKNAALMEMLRIIHEEEPSRPSIRLSSDEALPSLAALRNINPKRLMTLLRGELDWVVMKCLEKQRDRRYETVNGLARDIQRYLKGDVVEARPPSATYRFRKFIRRNKTPVIFASLFAVLLIAGIVGTSWGFFRANGARRREMSQRERAEAGELQAIIAVRRFADVISKEPELKNSPELEALRERLLGEPITFFEDLRERLLAEKDLTPASLSRLADASYQLGFLTSQIGDPEDALRALGEARAVYEKLLEENPNDTRTLAELAGCLNCIGLLLLGTGHTDDARQVHESALEIWIDIAASDPDNVNAQHWIPRTQANLASSLRAAGRTSDALQLLVDAGERLEQFVDTSNGTNDKSDLIGLYNRIVLTQYELGNSDEAMAALLRAKDIAESLSESRRKDASILEQLGQLQFNIGLNHHFAGRRGEAADALTSALVTRKTLADEHPTVTRYQADWALSFCAVGSQYLSEGDITEAREAMAEALKIQQKLVDDHPEQLDFASQLGATHHQIAMIDHRENELQDAQDRLQEAIRWQRKAFDSNPAHPLYKRYLANHWQLLANTHQGLGNEEGLAKAKSELSQLLGQPPNLPADSMTKKPANNRERLAHARNAFQTSFYCKSARLMFEAFTEDPWLAADPAAQHRYNASRAAVLAASGKGIDPPAPEDPERTKWRNQALEWMREGLADQNSLLDEAQSQQEQMAVEQALKMWQQTPAFEAVREKEHLDQLPETEQTDWQAFWSEVDELLTQLNNNDESSLD